MVHHCVYCGHNGPSQDFDNEHVFSRALCGTGSNWTLTNCVCKTCNGRFSKFESEMLHQAAETVARGFSGPMGRSARNANGARIQPLKINHLYAINANDPLVFEAGFAFPAEFYFRPQMVDVGDGSILALVTNANEMQGFQTAMTQFAKDPKDVTLPRPKKQKDYDIVTFDEIGGHWRPGTRRKSTKPSRLFFRHLSTGSRVPPMTARLAQNDDGNLFVRAKDLDAVGVLFDSIFANRMAGPRPPLPPGPGQQTWVFGLEFNYVKIFKAVLKTGMNLVAHLFGDDALRNSAFDRSRSILLECPETDKATKICRLYPHTPADFPRPNSNEHQMMLDVHQGALRFRMRLYGSFGYEAILAPSIAALATPITDGLPRRVLVDHARAGIHEVASW